MARRLPPGVVVVSRRLASHPITEQLRTGGMQCGYLFLCSKCSFVFFTAAGGKVQVMVNADEDLDVDVVCGPGRGALIVPEEELLVGAQGVLERTAQL